MNTKKRPSRSLLCQIAKLFEGFNFFALLVMIISPVLTFYYYKGEALPAVIVINIAAWFFFFMRPTKSVFFSTLDDEENTCISYVISILDAVFWFSLAMIYIAHLIFRFGFPKPFSNWQLFTYFIMGCFLLFIFYKTIGKFMGRVHLALRSLFWELEEYRKLIRRIFSIFTLYIGMDLLFAAIYNLISLHVENAFDPSKIDFINSLYFSTVTITTLGYGDVKPVNGMAKMLVSLEALIGVLLLAIVLGVAFSLSSNKKGYDDSDMFS